ncbi:MAG: hypothetical protein KAS17_01700, partial [Victivallaceae bacterium]|nr:hypothetical protein [Victivallaceae bacterium]
IIEAENPKGAFLQLGDTKTYELADVLDETSVPILGTSMESINRLYKRERFHPLLQKLDIRQPSHGIAENAHDAYMLAEDIGYPVSIHPAMPIQLPSVDILHDEHEAGDFFDSAGSVTELYPITIEKFLAGSREFHIEAIADENDLFVGGVIEYIEKAGVNTSDSAAVWPPITNPLNIIKEGRDIIKLVADELNIKGLIGVKLAFFNDKLYLLDAFPGATKSTAFINKMSGEKFIPYAMQIALGNSLKKLEANEPVANYVAVRAPVFPFAHFPESDVSLGPESCSTGGAVGIDFSFGAAYAKALIAADNHLPTKGTVLLSVADKDKQLIIDIAKQLRKLGFDIEATSGTSAVLQKHGLPVKTVMKIQDGRPNVIDHLIDGNISLIINTPGLKANKFADTEMRHEAVARGILVITTIAAAQAAVEGIEAFMRHGFEAKPFEDYIAGLRYQHSFDFNEQSTFAFDS